MSGRLGERETYVATRRLGMVGMGLREWHPSRHHLVVSLRLRVDETFRPYGPNPDASR
jgi:hypothetical protein